MCIGIGSECERQRRDKEEHSPKPHPPLFCRGCWHRCSEHTHASSFDNGHFKPCGCCPSPPGLALTSPLLLPLSGHTSRPRHRGRCGQERCMGCVQVLRTHPGVTAPIVFARSPRSRDAEERRERRVLGFRQDHVVPALSCLFALFYSLMLSRDRFKPRPHLPRLDTPQILSGICVFLVPFAFPSVLVAASLMLMPKPDADVYACASSFFCIPRPPRIACPGVILAIQVSHLDHPQDVWACDALDWVRVTGCVRLALMIDPSLPPSFTDRQQASRTCKERIDARPFLLVV